MCRASRSEIPWHKCQVTSSAGWIRNEGPCCHRCVLKLVPSILLLLEDAGCGYSFQEGVTGMSTSSWKEIKHKAATAPMYVVHWHLQGHCYLWKMGSKPQGTENFINCSMFYIIRKVGLTLALLENSGFKGGGDRHVPNAWVTLPWSCFGIYKLVVLRGMDGTLCPWRGYESVGKGWLFGSKSPTHWSVLSTVIHSGTLHLSSCLNQRSVWWKRRVVTENLRVFFFSLAEHHKVFKFGRIHSKVQSSSGPQSLLPV